MQFLPQVNPAREFLEIANDFTDAKEVVREAISNAFDATATRMWIRAYIDRSTGDDELVLSFRDNGEGMDESRLKSFFGLGMSTRVERDALGNKVSGAIGEKGHGTKVYFNSRRIEVSSTRDGHTIDAVLDEPRKTLRRGEVPNVDYTIKDDGGPTGTEITIYGYNDNNQVGFEHRALKDYILWFTKIGSFERALSVAETEDVALVLTGLGNTGPEGEAIAFGHPFPEENTSLTNLKKTDKVSPFDYYVARWAFKNEPVLGMPSSNVDIVFYIEGDQAKRQYNKMIHKKYHTWREGEYNVEQRYGLWVAKDYIPIARKNEWVSQKSEWTKYHAFVNSQDFRLTANRSNLDNTPPKAMECIRRTVETVFKEKIATSEKFLKYQEELQKHEQYKDAEAEGKDFERRKKAALRQKIALHKDTTLVEPRQEGGVFSLTLQLLTLDPDLFGFSIIDYDTAYGYDLLVTKDTALDLSRAALRFVEMKYELKREFSHSFKHLAAVICWDTKIGNEEQVSDLAGAKRTLRITPRGADGPAYTKFMLTSDTEEHNIEVFVLKEFLREKLGITFAARSDLVA